MYVLYSEFRVLWSGVSSFQVSILDTVSQRYRFSALQMYRPALGLTHLCVVHWVLGNLSLGIRQAVCEAGHSLPSSTDKNERSFTSTPLMYLHGLCRENVLLSRGWVCPRARHFNKTVPLKAWSGPEGSSKLKVPRFLDNGTGWW
jgi:hypothetical protein